MPEARMKSLHPRTSPLRSAGLVIIGNEILSGSVRDENIHFLTGELHHRGVSVERILVIPDDPDLIGREVRAFSEMFDVVITTGGVGPTHDDVTFEGIARGFGVPVVIHEELAGMIRQWYGKSFNESALKMARLPEGAEILSRPGLKYPPILFGNVFILPGIPSYLKRKFPIVGEYLSGIPIHRETLHLKTGETVVASSMESVASEFPDVSIGSYPLVDNPAVMVKVILESRDREKLEMARRRLIELFPAGALVEEAAGPR